jgi:FlaA1/EpsC-like NDP-sugar epimerase
VTRLPRAVEERLLGRPVRNVLTAADRLALAGQRVLVTGAGGTLGDELARQIAECGPERLVLLDHAEYAVFRLEAEMRQQYPACSAEVVLGDVTRPADVRAVCTALRPDVVYHAAAYKHVPITERAIVPAVRTNVLGTLYAARAARDAGARFVLISTDKAAEPRGVMGATKRLAELVALGMASASFRPIAVRFGNILGSSGSLLEIMAACVDEGRNVPITHPGATRFFMTAAEAVSLVLKADLMGGAAQVYWLDMGEPLRIGDLARAFIACATPAGRDPVGIDVIGLRPGEKLREELTTQGLEMGPTRHPRIWTARQRPVRAGTLALAIKTLQRAAAAGDAAAALRAIEQVVEDFQPSDAARAASPHAIGALPTSAPAEQPALTPATI